MTFTIRWRNVAVFLTGVVTAVIVVWAFQGVRAAASAGGDTATFVPIEPCRLLETRPEFQDTITVPSRAIALGTSAYTIQATGPMGNCDITPDAVGIVLNVTPVSPTTATDIRLYPTGGTMPEASNLNPAPGHPPTPNSVTVGLSTDGRFDILNRFGDVHIVIDIAGYYTHDLSQRVTALETAGIPEAVRDRLDALEADVDALETANTAQQTKIDALETLTTTQQAKIDALETLTTSMSTTTVDGYPVVRFTGVNLQIVDGTGDTRCGVTRYEACNGLGNLIIGYHEDTVLVEARTGAHNIVTGTDNDYTSHSGIIAGSKNTTSGEYASVTGGFQNTASGGHASVTGGNANTASGSSATVSGGWVNTASAIYTTVSGGGANTASNVYASVSGGYLNKATGDSASVSGGYQNTATGQSASVSGGWNCTRGSDYTWGVGGPGMNAGCAPTN